MRVWALFFLPLALPSTVPSAQVFTPKLIDRRPSVVQPAVMEAVRRNADAGDTDAQYYCGLFYHYGEGVQPDPARASLVTSSPSLAEVPSALLLP